MKEVFSIENLVCLFFLGGTFCLYYYGCIFIDKPEKLGFSLIHYGKYIGIYFIFIICNVLLLGALIYKKFKHDIVYYLVIGELILLPLFHMGLYNDFVMRVSIPALFMFMCMLSCYTIEEFPKVWSLIKRKEVKKNLVYVMSFLVFAGLMINGVSYDMQRIEDSIFEVDFTALGEMKTYGTMEFFANRHFAELPEGELEEAIQNQPGWEADVMLDVDLVYNYFSYDIDENLFCKYIARQLK